MIRFNAFGYPSVLRDGQPIEGAARQRRVLALLALVAASRDRGISRDRVLAMLWPEAATEKARQALTQGLYHARNAIGQNELFLAASDLRLNRTVCSSDVWDFEDAIERGNHHVAVELFGAPYLDGFLLGDAPDFEPWVAAERARLTAQCARSLEQLASAAVHEGDIRSAVRWRRRLAALDPLDSVAALELIKTLALAGDRTGALQHARVYETLIRQELEVAPDHSILELAARLRDEAAPDAFRHARVSGSRRPNATPAFFAPNADSHGVSSARNSVNVATPSRDEDRSAASKAPVAPASPKKIQSARRRFRMIAAVGCLLGALAIATFLRAVRAPDGSSANSDLLVVTPFRVSGADPSLAFLEEGLVDLIASKLSDEGETEVVDPSIVVAAWHSAGGPEPSGARQMALALGRKVGAGRVVLGSVVGNQTHLILSASALDVSSASVKAQAFAEGPSDSLTAIVDQLVTRLVAGEAGISERLLNHTSTSLRAVRAYLDGQAAFRRGQNRDALAHFRRALDADPSFAMAALGLAQAADRMNARADLARGLASAWQHQADLIERDRIWLQALAGPRYPAPSGGAELLAAWERATAANPERAEVWVGLGKQLFYHGRLLGIKDADERALAAFRRASEIDNAFASPLQFQLQLAAASGDTLTVASAERAYLRRDSLADLAPFIRWRAAVALGDSNRLTAIRRSFPMMSSVSLRSIALSSLYQGIDGRDAENALAALRGHTVRASDRADLLLAEHALALSRGRFLQALDILTELDQAQPLSPVPDRLRVLDALYAGTDSVIGARSAITVAKRSARSAGGEASHVRRESARDTVSVVEDVCVAAQWSAWHKNADSVVRAAALRLTRYPSERRDAVSSVCVALVQAILAVREHTPNAAASLARIDSMLLEAPPAGTLLSYANLALSRLYTLHGDEDLALRVAHRRQHLEPWPTYLTEQFRERARIASLVGDTATAVRSYRQFLSSRSRPDVDVRDDVRAARRELNRLIGAS